MNKLFRNNPSVLGYLFFGTLLVTISVYILRGIGWLTFIPGGIILVLFLLSVITGILYGVDRTRRF